MTSAPRSLFKSVNRAPAFRVPIADTMDRATAVAIFEQRAGGLGVMLAQMESLADHAAAEDQAERAQEYAARIHAKADLVRQYVKVGDAEAAAREAILVAEIWMQLRADVNFAAAVREKSLRLERGASAITDADILEAISSTRTLQAAADKLGITTRQLRRRIDAIKKRTR